MIYLKTFLILVLFILKPFNEGAKTDLNMPSGFSKKTVGAGVIVKNDTTKRGGKIAVIMGGMGAQLSWVEGWGDNLYNAALDSLGVKWVFSVAGPVDEYYKRLEIDIKSLSVELSKIADITGEAPEIFLIAHSSGVFPAHQLFDMLFNDKDDRKDNRFVKKIHYFSLDGEPGFVDGYKLTDDMVKNLAKMYSVYAYDKTTKTISAMKEETLLMHTVFSYNSKLILLVVENSGCNPGAIWCVHDVMVNSKPHKPSSYDLKNDYTNFSGNRKVNIDYLKFYNNN